MYRMIVGWCCLGLLVVLSSPAEAQRCVEAGGQGNTMVGTDWTDIGPENKGVVSGQGFVLVQGSHAYVYNSSAGVVECGVRAQGAAELYLRFPVGPFGNAPVPRAVQGQVLRVACRAVEADMADMSWWWNYRFNV